MDATREGSRLKEEGQNAQSNLKAEANISTSVRNTGTLANEAEKQSRNHNRTIREQLDNNNEMLTQEENKIKANSNQGAVNVQVAIENDGAYPRPQDPDDIPKSPEVVGDIPPNPNNQNRR